MASSSAALLLIILMLALAASSNRAVAAEEEEHQGSGSPDLTVVNLQGRDGDGDGETLLAVKKHDLSLAGFTNWRGDWHAFPDYGHLFPTSTPLAFRNSYDDLIGGLGNLPGVPLGGESRLHAARALSAYDPATADAGDLQALKRALAALTVMLCEAQRVTPIKDTVSKGWDSGAHVAPEHLRYIEHWDTMSYEILHADRTGKWDGFFTGMLRHHANIHSEEEALAVVGVLVNRTFGEVFINHAATISSKAISDRTGLTASVSMG